MGNRYISLNNQVFQIENCKIVPIRFEDRFDIMEWRNDQIFHLRQTKPITKDEQNLYFNNVVSKLFEENKPTQILFSFLENNKCIGYGGLVNINWVNKNAEISFLLNTKFLKSEFNFYWTKYLELIELVAFKELLLHKIYTYAFDLRPHLYTTLENCGYKNEAILKEHCLFENKFIDVYIHEKRNYFELIKLDGIHEKLLFEWANETDVRNNSINSEHISWDMHQRWFSKKLDDKNCKIFVLKHCENLIGQIRIEKTQDNFWMINYSIDKHYRGNGYGTIIVGLLLRNYSYKFSAIVKFNNFASQKVFDKFGFKKEIIKREEIIKYSID